MFQPLLVLAIQITLAARSPSNLRDSDSQLKAHATSVLNISSHWILSAGFPNPERVTLERILTTTLVHQNDERSESLPDLLQPPLPSAIHPGTELPLLFRAPSNLPRTSIVVTGTKWRKGTVWRHKPQDATDITGVKKHPGTQW
ncbi:hypothetical protein N7492_004725 [Penicillium capsulatum]|uniref:Secreted protein n=1 Tax=Penicillium capsulatum TaxID=69766 RepID=A0A9W9IC39_9EURO|nr:hypothetical protein N7492_004725 [Penicillium capsulatum]